MKFKGKIIQIVKEEEYKKMGFNKYVDCDYINIRPLLENEPIKYFPYILILGLVLFVISLLLDYGLLALLSTGIIPLFIYYNNRKIHKYTKGKYWYFDSPIPIKKPHNFEKGNEIEIEININKLW